MMKIRINGEDKNIEDGSSVSALLEELGISLNGIAVELNREIVPKGRLSGTELKEGDTVEVVRMVGGG